jgi:hypothetical protein
VKHWRLFILLVAAASGKPGALLLAALIAILSLGL